jgi:uncharacterized membrane protein YwaF
MRELFFKLFEMSHFDSGIKITAFSIPHFVYMFLIFGGIFLAWWILRKKDAQAHDRALRFLAYALVLSYLSDFFVHDFVYGGLNMDKLPFHICTVLCPTVAITQFNHRGDKIREPVAVLATLAPLMYLCYPASVGDGEPWCYQAVQTMFFHGVLLAWGVLNLALGKVRLSWKNCWHSGVGLVGITLWAKLGNVLLEHNWFFLNEDCFYIGLVANGVIPRWSLMILNPIIFFLAVLLVYAVAYPLQKNMRQKAAV